MKTWASEWAEECRAGVERRNAVKALVGRYPDLAERVRHAVSVSGRPMERFDQWSGYVPTETYNSGGLERPNTSPIRAALVEIVQEARERYAQENHGEVPW